MFRFIMPKNVTSNAKKAEQKVRFNQKLSIGEKSTE
jgi:hypothetical protein